MNSKIEKLLNEQTKNNTKIEDYKERITALQDSIKKLNARNREIDAEIDRLKDEEMLSIIKEGNISSADILRLIKAKSERIIKTRDDG